MKTLCGLAFVGLLALCICSVAYGKEFQLNYHQDEAFLSWCAEFLDSESDDYLSKIYPAWKENAEYVQKHNSLGLPYSLSLNKFAHLSRNDFVNMNLHSMKFPQSDILSAHISDPPVSVDWRKKGYVPPVSDQGSCGDPTVFQTVGAVDSFHAIQTGTVLLGSVEEYVDCCYNGSCDGGFLSGNYNCIVEIGGLALKDVYVSPDHKCLNDTFKPAIKIDGGKYLTLHGNETQLAYAVAMQPVVTGVDASHTSFQLYSSGVYYEPDCSSVELDHVLLVVGYGATQNGVEYWICQNSWGTSWGMDGYIYMARNRNNNCGIANTINYPY